MLIVKVDSKKLKNLLIIFLLLVVGVLIFNSKGSDLKEDKIKLNNSEAKLKLVKDVTAELELEEYSNSDFSMKKPKGWKVQAAGSGVYYAIRVVDANNTNNGLFLMLKMQPFLKSEEAKNFWKSYYQMSNYNSQYKLFAEAVVLNSPTVECFYQKFGEITGYLNAIEPTLASFSFPEYAGFTKEEELDSNASMKSYALDSKVLRGTFKGESGVDGEGLFMASIVNFGDNYMGNVDTAYYMVYDIVSVTSTKGDFINYKDILLEAVNSIEFSNSYVNKTIDDSNAQTKQALEINRSVQQAFDSYMSAWENRNKSYDIMSQKQSDATLGYERVYDVDTGDIYKAYNGFSDDYDGKKYQSVTDDMYTERTSGYIEKVN